MEFHDSVDHIIAYVRDNAAWAPPIVFALAFGESLAFISLLIRPGARWSRSAR